MKHIAPHRWADVRAGRVTEAEIAAMERHVGSCDRCAAERERIASAIDAFADIRELEAPELSWDHIGARIYWVTSSERRGHASAGASGAGSIRILSLVRRAATWKVMVPAAAVAGIAIVATFAIRSPSGGQDDAGEPGLADEVAAPSSANPTAASGVRDDRARPGHLATAGPGNLASAARPDDGLRGAVTMLRGGVSLNGQPLGFDDAIAAGSRLATGEGQVTIQYDDNSGFTVMEDSIVTVVRFQPDDVILTVDGALVADVNRRDDRHRFTVRAGHREVRVKGTVFRVDHRPGDSSSPDLEVSCSRGQVVVVGRDGGDQIAVDAGELARFVASGFERHPLELPDPDDDPPMEPAVPLVPTWTGFDSLLATSSRLEIAPSAGNRASSQALGIVEVDGVGFARRPFSLRVNAGRHHVRSQGGSGQWLEVESGAVLRPVLLAPGSAPGSGSRVASGSRPRKESPRRAEIRRVLDERIRIDGCLRSLRKQGAATGDHVALELGVGKRGELEYLEITDSDLPGTAEQCVRDAIDSITFPPGAQTSLRYRITL